MSNVDLDMSEVRRFADDLQRSTVVVPVAVQKARAQAGREMHENMRNDAPVASGELRDGIYLRETATESTAGTDVEHGFYQEFGTVDMPPQPWAFHNADRAEETLVSSVEDIDVL